jgi:ornithine--oxo-acid transaminase
MDTRQHIEHESRFSAHNYHPIPVVIEEAQGVWIRDVDGRKYIDMLSAYSAVNQGHRHPRIIDAAVRQMGRVTLTSRAFHNDRLGAFCQKLAELAGMDSVLPMNTGAEAVETAIKCARRFAYRRKVVPADRAEIIVAADNFHGRTSTIISFSSDPGTRKDFGPFAPGFVTVPYGDLAALEKAITPNTAAFLFEPIQGEAGVVVPPDGYVAGVRALCSRNNVLMVADEIQTGLGRCGRLFACDLDDVKPDIYVLGKALGGGLVPISAIVARNDVMSVFDPGSHGSTFGGNPLACAIAMEALDVIIDERLPERADEQGRRFRGALADLVGRGVVKDVRGRGLLNAVEIDRAAGPARPFTMRLKDAGVLAKETHDTTIRFAPPLTISDDEMTWALDRIRSVLTTPAAI